MNVMPPETDTTSPNEALDALASMRSIEAKLAARAGHCPPWRHAAFGSVMAALVASSTVPTGASVLLIGAAMLGVVLIARWDRKHYGVFINGYRSGATQLPTYAFLALIVTLVVAGRLWAPVEESLIAQMALILSAFAAATGFSILWHRIYRRELGAAED